MKTICAVLLIIGLALFLCGIQDVNSIESFLGAFLALIGFIILSISIRKEEKKMKGNKPPYRNHKTW